MNLYTSFSYLFVPPSCSLSKEVTFPNCFCILSWTKALSYQLMEECFITSHYSSKWTRHKKMLSEKTERKRCKLLKSAQTSSQINVLPTETYQFLKVCIRPSHTKKPSFLSKRQELFFFHLLYPHFSSSVPISSDSLMAYFTSYWFSALYFISPWPSNSIAKHTFHFHPVEKQCWFAFLPDVKQPVYV